jgi:hypothetical protein
MNRCRINVVGGIDDARDDLYKSSRGIWPIGARVEKAIEQTSRGKIEAFISGDIPRGEMDHLQKSESLFLLYGAQVGRVGTFNHRAAVDDRPDRPGR